MTPVERLQAAIDKLEQERAAGSVGYWTLVGIQPFGYGIEAGSDPFGGDAVPVVHRDEISDADATLVVTLHRTIYAQLAILRDVLAGEKVERHWDTLVYTINALALADAILGGES